MGRDVRIRVLGPFEVETADGPVEVRGRLRVLLASLAFSANEVVPVWRLLDHVWPGESPQDLRNGVQSLVSRLRRKLGPGLVETGEGGYLLRVDAEQLDLLLLRELVASAARAARDGDGARESALLREAVALWRGGPLEDVASPALRAEAGPAVAELWFAARERVLDIALAEGREHEVIADLRDLTARHPLRESLWTRLMLALHRVGRRAEALEAYRRVSTSVRDELGLDVARATADLHRAILADDEALGPAPAITTAVPRQLPAGVRGFVGRAEELTGLDRLIGSPSTGRGAPPIVISAIDGTAGIGKTTLAVHWAHQVEQQFPDGQLYLNLHGYGPTPPVDAADALDVLLRSLGLAADRVPQDTDERAARWRTELAARRVLVVLDNARDSAQVRPLLPGSGSVVVVTSRRRLRGLSAREGAHHVTLGLLSPAEALELFADKVGATRVAAEPDAAAAIVELCARLPLAVRLAADHAARNPEWPLASLRDELAGRRDRLDVLSAGDDTDTDLRSLFDWSHRALDADARAMFDVLGLHPGEAVGRHAAAALVDATPGEAAAALGRLVEVSMLQQRLPDRYESHDLLKQYARDRARTLPGAPAAVSRLMAFYLRTAELARSRISAVPHRMRVTWDLPGAHTPDLVDHHAAVAWFDREHDTIAHLVLGAEDHGLHDQAATLFQLSWHHLYMRGHWRRMALMGEAAVRSAVVAGDLFLEGKCANGVSTPYGHLGRGDRQVASCLAALAIFEELGDVHEQATSLLNLGSAYNGIRRFGEAVEPLRRAARLYERCGEELSVGMARNNLADSLVGLGRLDEAREPAVEALRTFRRGGEPARVISGLETLAEIRAASGDHHAAIAGYREAVALVDEIHVTRLAVPLRVRLGQELAAVGEVAEARHVWREAHERGLASGDQPSADQVRALLAAHR
ncbi:BTAD domain-containing putative transcriptional regulator [Saccharothrix sp. BKS2]|uniref:AfsR/SARP family transcriptional regulator n=1 Tax=Saccharothrix sp. BKS2 TaxID=3064400 RepID=UPI0039E9C55F